LHAYRRARQGARPARAAAEDAVPPFDRLAQDRPQLRSASQEPAIPEARRCVEVAASYCLVGHAGIQRAVEFPTRPMPLSAGPRLGPAAWAVAARPALRISQTGAKNRETWSRRELS